MCSLIDFALVSNHMLKVFKQMKEIRAKVDAYFKLHPPLHLFSTSFQMAGHGINFVHQRFK
jgi:hypothetical protein